MKEKAIIILITILIIMVVFGIVILEQNSKLHIQNNVLKEVECKNISQDIQVVKVTPLVPVEKNTKWKCKVVVGCEDSDWRYTKPEDVCEYEFQEIESVSNPVQFEAYGGHCYEI